MTFRAWVRKREPSGVNSTPTGSRRNSDTPRSSSSCCSAAVTVDCVTFRLAAAKLTWLFSAVATKYRICLKVKLIVFFDTSKRFFLFYNTTQPAQAFVSRPTERADADDQLRYGRVVRPV